MSELLESVKRLAESQESRRNVSYYSHSRSEVSCEADKFDFPALAKHLARLERVEEAAKEHVAKHEADWKRAVAKSYTKAYANEFWPTHGVVEEGVAALDAALSENTDVE